MTGEVRTLWMRRTAEVLLVTNSRISLLGAGSTNITAMAAVTAVPPTRTCHTTYAAASIVGRVTSAPCLPDVQVQKKVCGRAQRCRPILLLKTTCGPESLPSAFELTRLVDSALGLRVKGQQCEAAREPHTVLCCFCPIQDRLWQASKPHTLYCSTDLRHFHDGNAGRDGSRAGATLYARRLLDCDPRCGV